ncbi:MAG: glycoside hydrolase family 3 N-terminal domain-containing protein [Solirubrobacterales bacterium]
MTRRGAVAGGLIAAVAASGGFVITADEDAPPADPARVAANKLTISQLVGQRIVTGYVGSKPTRSVLRAVRRGRVGGVILFRDNVQDQRTARRVTRRLQREARVGKQPFLFVMIDQEGGDVKRIDSIPPKRSPQQIGDGADVAIFARREGFATGRALRRLGVNVDLAPVADVPDGPDSFLGTRAFSRDRDVVAAGACGFAAGLKSGKVGSAFKHFPGLGCATANTDDQSVRVTAPRSAITADLRAYSTCPATPSMVMLASATYPSLGIRVPAVLSPATYELLADTGFSGLTISDALDTPSLAEQKNHQRRAVNAGLDLLLYAQTKHAASRAFRRLAADARSGTIAEQALRDSATRILQSKLALQNGDAP